MEDKVTNKYNVLPLQKVLWQVNTHINNQTNIVVKYTKYLVQKNKLLFHVYEYVV